MSGCFTNYVFRTPIPSAAVFAGKSKKPKNIKKKKREKRKEKRKEELSFLFLFHFLSHFILPLIRSLFKVKGDYNVSIDECVLLTSNIPLLKYAIEDHST